MSKRETYEARTEELITPILERMDFELVDVEYVKEGGTWYLRAYIDKPGGITVNDCEEVSREMNEILDREDYIKENYTFVVSSPGLDRPLKRERDFMNSIGRQVEIKTYKAIDGYKEFTGTLVAYDKDTVTVDEGDGERVFNRKDISMIRLAFEI